MTNGGAFFLGILAGLFISLCLFELTLRTRT